MAKSLMQSLPEVDERIREADRLALFLDFDGTLAPIVEDPAAARMSGDVWEALRNVARQDGIVTTIISGRAVEDVYSKVRVEGLIYAGNHGMEIFGRNLSFTDPAAAADDPLTAQIFAIPGVTTLLLLEDFVTVGKSPAVKWSAITPKVKKILDGAKNMPK